MTSIEPDTAVDDAAENTEPTTEALKPADAERLLASLSVSTILKTLKSPDFDLASGRVFTGFRVGADFLKNPIAKRQLVVELINDPKLVKALQEAQSVSPPAPPVEPKHAPTAKPTNGSEKAAAIQHHDDKLVAERDKLKRDLIESNRAAAQHLNENAQFVKRVGLLEATIGELQRTIAAVSVREKAHLRRIKRLESELDEARAFVKAMPKPDRLTNSGQPSSLKRQEAEKSANEESLSAVAETIDRLISRQKTDIAAIFAEEMLHVDPTNVEARRARALVNVAKGDRAAALDDLRTIFDGQLRSGDSVGAAQTLARSVVVTREPDARMASSLFAMLAKQPVGVLQRVAETFVPIAGTPGYDALRSLCRTKLCEQIFPQDTASGDGSILPQPLRAVLGDNLTAAKIVRAIDRNDISTVHAVRVAIQNLDKRSREVVDTLIGQAGDHSHVVLLNRKNLQGPAIIDASNVANYELEILGGGTPRLANVLAVRQQLRLAGYFPIHMIGDANLTYVVDDKARAQSLLRDDELRLVPGGTDADEEIIRDALRYDAIIVTNDKYSDWDKSGDIDVVEYSISMTDGRATLYF